MTNTTCLRFTTDESLIPTHTQSIMQRAKSTLHRLKTDKLKVEISSLIQRLVKNNSMCNLGVMYEVCTCCLRSRTPVSSSDKYRVSFVSPSSHTQTRHSNLEKPTKHRAIVYRRHCRRGKIAGVVPAAHARCGCSHCVPLVACAHRSDWSPPLATVCCHLVAVWQGLHS